MFASGENSPVAGIWRVMLYPTHDVDHLAILGRIFAGEILRKTSEQKDMLQTFFTEPVNLLGLCCIAGSLAPLDGSAIVSVVATGMAD